jgi:CheY-like chemotaxis protein
MDGIETAKRLRETGYTKPIVALTANAVAGQAEMFLQNGFDGFMSKPVDVKQLDGVLHKYIKPEKSTVSENILKSFAADAKKVTEKLDGLITEGLDDEKRMRDFTITIHGIAGALHNIKHTELAEKAGRLEKAGKENDAVYINDKLADFMAGLKDLLDELNPKGRTEMGTNNTEDIGELREALLSIKQMCADYDRKGVLDAIAEIQGMSEKTRAIIEKINGLVRHSDFDEAEATVDAYLNELPAQQEGLLKNRKIAGLDIERGLERYEGGEKIYLKILRSYVTSVKSILDGIRSVPSNGLDDYRIKIHGIKGASYDLPAQDLGRKAEALEKAAAAGDFGFIDTHNRVFLKEADRFLADIELLFASIENENPKPTKDKPDTALLKALCAACGDFSMNKAEEAMAEIEKFKYTDDDGLVEWLRRNVDMVNFGDIVEKLGE